MSASADLAVLRTAKLACDEQLINPDDYDQIKKAFLRAQQIKAGMDAGFLREEDFLQARDSFLHSLDFSLVASTSAYQAPQSFPLGAAPAPAPTAPSPIMSPARPQPVQLNHQRVSSVKNLQEGSASAAASPTRRAPQDSGLTTFHSVPGSSGGGGVALPPVPAAPPPPPPPPPPPVSGRSTPSNSIGSGTVPVPTEFPKMGRGSLVSSGLLGKKSMSGIGVNENCLSIFNLMKAKSTYKWVSFKVNDEGNEVIIDQCGAPDATYDQFIQALPENMCRYAVYDYAYLNADTQQTVNKLVFVHWGPDTATTKAKMMYASTKDFFKGYLDGIGADMQATSASELSEAEIRERVHQAITRK